MHWCECGWLVCIQDYQAHLIVPAETGTTSDCHEQKTSDCHEQDFVFHEKTNSTKIDFESISKNRKRSSTLPIKSEHKNDYSLMNKQ